MPSILDDLHKEFSGQHSAIRIPLPKGVKRGITYTQNHACREDDSERKQLDQNMNP